MRLNIFFGMYGFQFFFLSLGVGYLFYMLSVLAFETPLTKKGRLQYHSSGNTSSRRSISEGVL
jgi:hypothetical protein